MRLTGSGTYTRPVPVPKMPVGLVELMQGLTKEVLKNNPPEIYEFCADHMQKLLEIRDGPSESLYILVHIFYKFVLENTSRSYSDSSCVFPAIPFYIQMDKEHSRCELYFNWHGIPLTWKCIINHYA